MSTWQGKSLNCQKRRPYPLTSRPRFSASLIMEIVFGHRVTSDNDEFIRIAERAAQETVTAGRYVFIRQAVSSVVTNKRNWIQPWVNLGWLLSYQSVFLDTRISKIINLDIVKLIPSWFPGGGFKKKAAVANKYIRRLYDGPHNMVRQRMVSYFIITPSYVVSHSRLRKQ